MTALLTEVIRPPIFDPSYYFFSPVVLTGIDQYDRDSIINDFKNGACRLMVATSVAARGLDVKQLILVVNYNCPNHYEDYVHRAGRTGRAGNKVRHFKRFTPCLLSLSDLCSLLLTSRSYRNKSSVETFSFHICLNLDFLFPTSSLSRATPTPSSQRIRFATLVILSRPWSCQALPCHQNWSSFGPPLKTNRKR